MMGPSLNSTKNLTHNKVVIQNIKIKTEEESSYIYGAET